MNYEIIKDSEGNESIIVDLGDGAFQSFPADPENPVYAAWLDAQEPTKAPKAK